MKLNKNMFGVRRVALGLIGMSIIAATTGSALAQSAAPRRIAVISLLGTTITVVTQASVTGTRLDRNPQDSFTVPNNLFDVAALGAANEALVKGEPTAVVLPLKLPSADMFGDSSKLFDSGKFAIPAGLAPTLKQIAATHLLVIARQRAPTNIKTAREGIGSGSLEGLGYFVNYQMELETVESSERRVGFLAPYTYFRMSMVDVASGLIDRESFIARAQTWPTKRKEGYSDPWETLTSVEKITVLRDLLTDRVKEAVPALLATP